MSYDDQGWRAQPEREPAARRAVDLAHSAEEGFAAVLRAVGSLLVALGDQRGPRAEPRAAAARPEPQPQPRPAARPAPPRDVRTSARGEEAPAIELMLEDARAQAHRIIDESVRQAQELLVVRPEEGEAIERLRRSVDDVAEQVRAMNARLDRIEAMLRAQQAAQQPAPAAPVAPAPAVSTPAAAAPRSTERASPPIPPPAPLRRVEQRVEPRPAPVAPVAQAAPAPPPPPPLSVVPSEAEAEAVAEYEASAERPAPTPTPVPAAMPPTVPAPAHAVEPAADRVRFAPDSGSVILRVSPVSGFQGLMRVQDALSRLPGVREATVEAYSQGEARLRLSLRTPLTTTEIAAGLASRLGQAAHVEASSEAERTVRLGLG